MTERGILLKPELYTATLEGRKTQTPMTITSTGRAESLTFEETLDTIAAATGVSVAEIQGRGRTKRIVAARHSVIWTLSMNGWSYDRIAALMGLHHTTVLHAIGRKKGRG